MQLTIASKLKFAILVYCSLFHLTLSQSNIKFVSKTNIGGIEVAITMYQATERVEVEMYGPIGGWFGVLFGNDHNDGDAFIYTTGYGGSDVAGSKPDYYIEGKKTNDCIKDSDQHWAVTEISQVGGKQKVVGSREFHTDDNEDYEFQYSMNRMKVWTACGSSLVFGFHGNCEDKKDVNFQSGTATPTTTTTTTTTASSTSTSSATATTKTTANITPQNVKFVSRTNIGSGIEVAITMNEATEVLEVEMYGPTSGWFGVLFDSHSGGDAFIYTTGYGGADNAGSYPDYCIKSKESRDCTKDSIQNWHVTEISESGGKQKVVGWRQFNTGDAGNDYTFQYTTNSMRILVACGSGLSFAFHGKCESKQTVYFQSGTVTPTTTSTSSTSTTSMTTPQNIKFVSRTNIGSGVEVAITMNEATEVFEVEMYGPIGGWFGVLLDSHSRGDAFIYTTGYGGTDDAGLYPDYSVKSKLSQDITKDPIQNWHVTEISEVGGKQKVVGWRQFETGDASNDLTIGYATSSVQILVACGTALSFGFHGNCESKQTVYFQSGTVTPPTTTSTSSTSTSSTTTTTTLDPNIDIKQIALTEIGAGSQIFVAITMTKSTGLYEIEMQGPNDRWFGIVWSTHFGGDAFLYVGGDGSAPDYLCGGMQSSDVVQDTVQSWSVSTNEVVNGKRKIIANRPFDSGDSSQDAVFDFAATSVTLLSAYGTDSNLEYHNANRWRVTLSFDGLGTIAPTTTTATRSTIATTGNSNVDIKSISLTEIGAGSGIFVAIKLTKSAQTFEIEMHGPNDRWFGLIFTNHMDGDAFIFVDDGSKPDYICVGKATEDLIEDTVQSWSVSQNEVVNGTRKISATRPFDTGDPDHDYPFDFNANTVTLLSAYGSDHNLGYHSSNRWLVTLPFDGSNVVIPTTTSTTTTVRATEYIDPNATIKVFPRTEIGYNSGIEIALKMDKNTEIFEVEMYGAIGKWFGVLFHSHHGGDAFIYSTNYDDMDAAGQYPDYSVKSLVADDITKDEIQNWNVSEVSVVDGKQKVAGFRKFNTGDLRHDYLVEFDKHNTLTVLVAHSMTDALQFGYHGQYRWDVIIDLASGGTVNAVESTEPAHAMNATVQERGEDDEDVDIKMVPLSEIGAGSGIFVAIQMTKSSETYQVEMHGPIDRWFGIVWENHYAGDALIYVGNGSHVDYICSGKADWNVHVDTVQSWTVHQNAEVDGTRQIIASRKFDTGDRDHDYPFDFTQKSVKLLSAYGVDNSLHDFGYHSTYRWEVMIDLESGGVSQHLIESYYLLNHAMFMFIGFGVIVPFALFLVRFKWIFLQRFQSFWIIPIARALLVLGSVAIWVGLLEKLGHSVEHEGNLDNIVSLDRIHSYLGLILVSVWTVCMVLQCIFYKSREKVQNEFVVLSNPVSCIIIISACFAQIYFGFKEMNFESIYIYVFGGYCAVYAIVYLMFECYQGSRLEQLIKGQNTQFSYQSTVGLREQRIKIEEDSDDGGSDHEEEKQNEAEMMPTNRYQGNQSWQITN